MVASHSPKPTGENNASLVPVTVAKAIMRSALTRIAIKVVAFFMMLLLAGGVGLWGYLYQAGGLKRYAESQLTVPDFGPDFGLEAEIGAASFGFFKAGKLATINFEDVALTLGQQTLRLPVVAINFDASLWARGQLWQVEVSQLTLDLVQGADGLVIDGTFATLLDKFDAPQGASQSGNGLPSPLAMLGNREWQISDSIVRLRKQDDDAVLQLEGLSLRAAHEGGGNVMMSGSADIKDGDGAIIAFDAKANINSGLTEVKVRANALPLRQLAPFLPERARPLAALGTLDSESTMLFDGALLQSAEGRLSARRGQLPNGARVNEISATIRYSHSDDYLLLSDVNLGLPDGQVLSFNGELAGVSLPQIRFGGTLTLTDIPIDALLSQWPKAALPDVRSYMISSFSDGDFQKISLDFKGLFDAPNSALSLSELSFAGDVANVRVQSQFGHVSRFVGTANGQLALEVMAGGVLKGARASLQVKEGAITTRGGSAPLRFADMSGDISYQPGQLRLQDMQMTLQDEGALIGDVTIAISEEREIEEARIALSSKRVSVAAVRALIPENLIQDVTAFMDQRIKGGWLTDGAMRLTTQNDKGTQKLADISVSASLDNVSLTYLAGQAPLRDISADLTIADDALMIAVTNATSPLFGVSQATISLAPLVATDEQERRAPSQLSIIGDVTGTVPHMVQLLKDPKINLIEELPITLDSTQGMAQMRVGLSAALDKGKPFALGLDIVDGTLTDFTASDIYQDYDLADGDIAIGYEAGRFAASGDVRLDELAGNFALVAQEGGMQVTGQIPPQEAVTARLQQAIAQQMSGRIGGRFTVDIADGGDKITAVIEGDVSAAAIAVPILNYAKKAGAQGRVSGRLHFKSGRLTHSDGLVIAAGDLNAKGTVQMGDDGALQSARLTDVSWADNQIDGIAILRKPDGTWHVNAQGPHIDLRNLRAGANDDANDDAKDDDTGEGDIGEGAEKDISEDDADHSGAALIFDITSEALVIDDEVSLFGQMTGTLDATGDGEARLQGTLLHKAKPLLEEATLTAIFGPSGEHLNAVGLIGGAEARLDYSPSETAGGVLIITTKNAGRVLSGLGITDTIRQGRMVLVNEYKSGGLEDFDTTINLEEFNVIEAPAAVRAFSVLGLAGLYALVEGDGTRFTSGEVQIETRGPVHNITKLVASGGAVGLTLVGEYNSETRQVDISGNLVPVNQFSKIISAVPLLGELLSGRDNAGIFATQFNLTGPIDAPQTTVNAASLVPGVLRDLFSPDWLARESKRLFGADNETANTD